MNYFAIERNGECWAPVYLVDSDGEIVFKELLNASYDEMNFSEQIEYFVINAIDAANTLSDSDYDQTIITLVGEDDVFIWSIIIGPDENDGLKYMLVNWQDSDKKYRYEPN